MATTEENLDSGNPSPDLSHLKLSLVIPAYNEGKRLAAGVSRLHDAVLPGNIDPETTEFVVVDDGSTDDTVACAHTLFAPYPHVQIVRLAENKGKGAAVRAGVSAASAAVIAFADADMSIDPAQTPEFLRALAHADIAIGSRAADGAAVDRPSIRRSILNRSFNHLVNLLTRLSLDDTQCGFKAFRAPAAKLLFHCSTTERFAFDVEILTLARRLGLSIDQVPVHWSRIEGSRVRPWLDPGSMARDVIRAGRRAASAPPVTALAIGPPAATTGGVDASVAVKGLTQELSPFLPVWRTSDGRITVLCPLMTEAQIDRTADRVRAHFPDEPLQRTLLTATQLAEQAPLALSWDV